MGNAEHHAQGVDEVVLTIDGAVLWRKDANRELEVLERDGRMANVLWVWIAGARYALTYNHQQRAVEIRRNNLRGEPLATFDNSTDPAAVKRFFASL